MAVKPIWRRMYDTWEKAAAPGLQDLTASPVFKEAVAVGARLNASVAREVERTSRQWLHAWNLPAAGDIRKLRRQVSSLDKELGAVRSALAATVPAPAAPVSELVLVDGAPTADAVGA